MRQSANDEHDGRRFSPPLPSPPTHAALSPVAPSRRLHILDVLRGFAILGILFVNIHFYSRPIYSVFRDVAGLAGSADGVVKSATIFLATEKFFSILSVLFGLGMAIMYERACRKGVRFGPLYLRRLVGLFAIGIAHALLLYAGDFIGNYAVLGLPLFFFRKTGSRALLAWSAVFLLVPCFMMAQGLFSRPPEATTAQVQQTQEQEQEQRSRGQQRREALERRIQESERIYGHGTVREIFRLRAREVAFQYSSLVFVGWKMFSMFLVGMWCWKSGLVTSLSRRLPFIRRVLGVSLLLGLLGCSLSLYGDLAANAGQTMQFVAFLGQEFGAPALAFFYMSAIVLLYSGGAAAGLLEALAPVGRMAMSNYVFQSLVCALLFHSYGLGLFNRTSYATNVLIALGLCVLQVVLSRAWLRHFSFGPLEWLLRWFVYLGRPSG